ncbi:MAG TPA: Rne/Rng family ribonuclease [Thermoanaerobacterales bacterium]|nr:Rne/Rng family ribonuclease [Thermoanaerobacterales bacterium]
MAKEIAVDAERDQTRAALLEDGNLVEIYIEKNHGLRIAGNIYKGKVANVLPGMQAAFVDIGLDKNAFLYVDDIYIQNEFLENGDTRKIKNNSIKDVLKLGQEIVVQVIKEPIGSKGARVTTNITIPGRYLVLMPTGDYIGISRRIVADEERDRLKSLAEEIKPQGMGLIVRTVAEGRNKEDMVQDLHFLTALWEKIQFKKKTAQAPKLIYKDLNLISRIVRDLFSHEIDTLYINNKSDYDRVLELLDFVAPNLKERVILFNRQQDIFDYFGVEKEIEKALNRKVWLKCGGYIVIDQTEALTSIDVNTGKYVGCLNLEDTVLKTNLEAAKEIARQLRIRDIGGIIIIDFIDMSSQEHQNMVLNTLEEELKKDKTKTHILGLTKLGLVEMTRKKVRQGLDELLQKKCPYCEGRGRIISEETMSKRVEKKLKYIISVNSSAEAVLVEVHPSVASVVIGSGGSHINYLEEQYNKTIFVKGNLDLHPEDIKIKAIGSKEDIQKIALPVKEGDILEVTIEEPHSSNPADGIARLEGYVVNIDNAGDKVGETETIEIYKTFKTYSKAHIINK